MTEEKLRKVAAAIVDALRSIESESERGDLACCTTPPVACCTTPPEQVLVAGDKSPARVCICLDLGGRERHGAGECC